MKFNKLDPFEKHFKDSFPDHLSPVYLVICPKESERKKILFSLSRLLEAASDYRKCSLISDALLQVNGGSLFSARVSAFFDGVEHLSKDELASLCRYVAKPNPSAILILGAGSSKNVSELYKKGLKEMVLLDLSKEKPWEEKERFKKWAVQRFLSEKKQITPAALELLLGSLPPNRILIDQEIEKLLCYVGEGKEVNEGHIRAIASSLPEVNLFQVAQQLIWGKGAQLPEVNDLNLLLPLIGILRSQLEIGLKLSCLISQRVSNEEIAGHFPKLWPKALAGCIDGTKKKGEPFFIEGLKALYTLEYGVKTSAAKPRVLFSMFLSRLGA